MSQTTFTVSMDADTTQAFRALCSDIGLSVNTAFGLFARKAVSEHRIPFEPGTDNDPFFSESNMKYPDKVISGIENGTRPLTEHDLIED